MIDRKLVDISSPSRIADISPDMLRNNGLSRAASLLVRSFETLGIRGAPTLLSWLSKFPALRAQVGSAIVGDKHRIVFPAFDPYWARYLWTGATYEPDVEKIFRTIGRGRVLLDCGANVGYWSMRAADFGFVEAIAVEANPKILPYLTENAKHSDSKCSVIHAAIYSTSGEHLFIVQTNDHAIAAIAPEGLPVESITIADICNRLPKGSDVVAKLDVEGAEVEAIKGAAGFDNIIFVYEDFLSTGMRVTEHVLESGMTVFGVSSSGEWETIATLDEAIAFNKRNSGPRHPSNLLACRPDKAAELGIATAD